MNEQHQYIEGFLPKEESVARIAQSSLYENGTVYPIPLTDLCGRFSLRNANSGFLCETLAHPLDEIIGSIEVRFEKLNAGVGARIGSNFSPSRKAGDPSPHRRRCTLIPE